MRASANKGTGGKRRNIFFLFPFCSRGWDSAKRESSTGIWAKLGILGFSASFAWVQTSSETAAQAAEVPIKQAEILTARESILAAEEITSNLEVSENGMQPTVNPVGLSVAPPENFPVSFPVGDGLIERAESKERNTAKSELAESKGQTINSPNTNFPNTNFPNTNFPNTNFPNTNFPNTNFPTTNFPTTNFPTTNFPIGNQGDSPLPAGRQNPGLEDSYFQAVESLQGETRLASPTENRAQQTNETNESLMQVTSVSELSDVQASDWAFQALQSLIERYGCLLGYRDGTYRGNRALTRYEFAATLDACVENIVAIASSLGETDSFNPEDLNTVQRLQEDFAAELASLEQDINRLEIRKASLEAAQFSTTTKLFGQAIFGIQGRSDNEVDFFPVDDIKDARDPSTQVNLINNIQLSLLTQLSPRSLVLAGVQMGNGSTAPRLTNDRRLGYEGDTNNTVVLSDLNYRQLVSNRFAIIVGPAGVNMANVFRGINRIESAGRGPISALGQRNPIINIGSGRAGFGFDWQISSRMSWQGVYAASTPADLVNGGILGGDDGDTSLGMQLTLTPIDTVDVSLNYVNAYSPFGVLGTGLGDDQLTSNSPLKTNAFGATVAWRISSRLTLGTWGGYTNSYIPGSSGHVETTNWMIFLNIDDLFARGDLAGIYVGQPPKIVNSDLPLGKNIPDLLADGPGEDGGQPGTTTHLEVFYRFAVSEDISVTPGVLAIFEPGHTPGSDTIFVGVLRTTFSF